MKRFHWPLQKLLDVTAQRELAVRTELHRMAQNIAVVQHELAARRQAVADALAELANLPILERIERQQTFARASDEGDRQIALLEGRLESLQAERQAKVEQFKALKAKRQTLEKLREEAMAKYRLEVGRMEQALLDESAQVSFARKLNSGQ